ncbi:acyl-CoA Delta(11) desaturase isoform X2 [Acyrthosiphon pisum]|uniref:Fatty acid desaturase domain-containing protein n=1 Tax=Acyrthosiphon pisum TaxID=7029 RepID=A0A8R2A6T9_ACYPI|nr:acyl-CoA Delta(11) desaturase isoform X2 [Acyrthosiphon pisum]|eukprot:XP_003247697.1 PREDICTED: acyl-CoA Delta(11) desaturase isoform X1 [Acyrthosiphon pisum]
MYNIGHSSSTMVQMGAKTTTITECDMLQQETHLLKDGQNEQVTTNYDREESQFPVSKQEIIWTNVVFITLLHVLFVYCFCNYFFSTKWQTYVWSFIVGGIGGFGVTGGAHRYFTHRSFKAKLPLQLILILCYTVSGQNNIPDWVRDHRVHHKFSETDADPHNANRGFFFSHVGWLMQRKHPEVYRKGKTIDMSDINNDPLVKFHTKHFLLFKMLFCFIIPVLISVYALNENWAEAISSLAVVRYVLNLNFTWSVNSVAHIWGSKPYDKRIQPAQNVVVSIVAMGEGWHNYHHSFPWDYRAAELGGYSLNTTTLWLDLFAAIGWAYDLKTASKQLIQQVAVNQGDGSWRQEPETAHARDYKTS